MLSSWVLLGGPFGGTYFEFINRMFAGDRRSVSFPLRLDHVMSMEARVSRSGSSNALADDVFPLQVRF